jgi:hypothetical protein
MICLDSRRTAWTLALCPRELARPAGLGTARGKRSAARRFPRTAGGDHVAERRGAPGRTRTCDPRLRRPMLYPPELRAPCGMRDCTAMALPNRFRARAASTMVRHVTRTDRYRTAGRVVRSVSSLCGADCRQRFPRGRVIRRAHVEALCEPPIRPTVPRSARSSVEYGMSTAGAGPRHVVARWFEEIRQFSHPAAGTALAALRSGQS